MKPNSGFVTPLECVKRISLIIVFLLHASYYHLASFRHIEWYDLRLTSWWHGTCKF